MRYKRPSKPLLLIELNMLQQDETNLYLSLHPFGVQNFYAPFCKAHDKGYSILGKIVNKILLG